MQRVKEELQDIAKALEANAIIAMSTEEEASFKTLASRIRNAGSLITHNDREDDAKKMALDAYKAFTDLVNEGLLGEI